MAHEAVLRREGGRGGVRGNGGGLSSNPGAATLRVAGLWRYPVKSLAGEPVDSTRLDPSGIPGDRLVHVRGPEGVRTSRRHHRLLGLRG
ncbi:MAG TPA: MOSC N-terminal beta barrel domain-containing protein, partial [Gemmatimonadota bacterium]|nr:MOSC N-terminal beta barrel domain-containing protein [Gemmatimonadota bacterium]